MNRQILTYASRVAVCSLLWAAASRAGTPATIDIDVSKPSHPMPPMFYGLMTEEINHSYDGGLYAELIQNRTFQDNDDRPVHWSAIGGAKLVLDKAAPVNTANPVCLRVTLAGDAPGGAANAGFWGIPVKPETKYAVSFYAKGSDGFAGPVTASLVGNDGTVYAKATSEAVGGVWKKYALTLTTVAGLAPTKDAKFALTATGKGAVSFNLVSLFPPTYMNTPGGLRPDLMKLMADLKPSFIRLPGGNYLEGGTFDKRFEWKKQVGPVDERSGHPGTWSYRSSDGMGLTGMLLWCRQLNAQPILAVFAGYVLRGTKVESGPLLQPFVDEALEEIEYVAGGPDTKWGKQRIADGLVEPFKLDYVEIGNEDWFDRSGSYDGRFTQFYDAIKQKYPHLKIIATAPVKSRVPDLYDDHFYQQPNAMVNDADHYDRPKDADAKADVRYQKGRFHGTFARGKVPDVLVGEWATQEGRPTPTHRAGLADAVWLMGMERNSDLVKLQCYAPLFANVNPKGGSQWGTNLIGFDAMTAFGSPSYHAQVMFAQNKVDQVLTAVVDAPEQPTPPDSTPAGMIGLGTLNTDVEYKELTVTDPDGKPLLSAATAADAKNWNFNGNWIDTGGVLKSANAGTETWGFIGDVGWADYTLRVKARKNGGPEGFLILWHAADESNYNWWNVGGWGNTGAAAQITRDGNRTRYGETAKVRVEQGKWYDVRIEVRGKNARCYLDDKLITDATDVIQLPAKKLLYAGAGLAGRDVIVKVVNFGGEPFDTTLHLQGVKSVKSDATITVLAGQPRDVNTVKEPTKVTPKQETIHDASTTMRRTFLPYSVTLIRFSMID